MDNWSRLEVVHRDCGHPAARAFLHACRVGRRTSCWRLLPSSKQRSRPARLLLVAVVGVASGRDMATTAALYVWARLSGPLDVTLLSKAAMPATAETRFVRSAGLSSSPKAPSDRGPASG